MEQPTYTQRVLKSNGKKHAYPKAGSYSDRLINYIKSNPKNINNDIGYGYTANPTQIEGMIIMFYALDLEERKRYAYYKRLEEGVDHY